ncbi:MAG: VWA domain-containing protein [Chloroflexi bacterium]|nr:VWA domain-containing protein [Chloroflexota bacterium]
MKTSSSQPWQTPQSSQPTEPSFNIGNCLMIAAVLLTIACMCGVLVILAGNSVWDNLTARFDQEDEDTSPVSWPADSAELTIAVSPGMAPVLGELAEQFNRQQQPAPDEQTMQVRTMALNPENIVEQSLGTPTFQALAPDSSLWLNQLEQRWSELQDTASEEGLVPIGNRRVGTPVRYATSPIVIAAWESVARDMGWPERPIGWQQIQSQATDDPNFKWNHPSTGHASGLLATLAEFYAGAGLTRGLTPEAATDPQTLEYVRAVEATVRFYGEGEQVIVQRLAAEGRDFLDAFVTQEHVIINWNQHQAQSAGEQLVAIYPAEGTLWADHPLALLELGGSNETSVTDNQRRTFQAFAQFLSSADVQRQLLAAGYRPADLSISLDESGSVFASSNAVNWRQPQTTLQIPSAEVVEVVQNVWWYTKRPTNVYLVVDTSGSMQGNKLKRTQQALQAFVSQIQGDRDRVGLIEFGSRVKLFEPLQPLDDDNRQNLIEQINRMDADGQTAMVDAVIEAFDDLAQTGDTDAINAIVVMTDGRENDSQYVVDDLRRRFEQEQDVTVVVFAIAFGSDADDDRLQEIANVGNGQFRRADETDIEELYKIISTYF